MTGQRRDDPPPSSVGPPSAAGAHAEDWVDGLEAAVGIELPPDVAAKIETVAVTFVQSLSAAPVRSAAFSRAIRAIDGLGDREVAATTAISARFHDRPVRAVEAMLDERGPLSRHLRELREIASGMFRRSTGGRPGVEAVTFDVAQVEERIRSLVESLDVERTALEADNAALGQQEQALWLQIEALREYAVLAARLDELVADRVDVLARADQAAAHALQVEGLYAIRRRRRDLLLQLAVATQGYSALRLIEQDNLEVVWAIRAATTTTATAFRAALLAARATSNRSPAGLGAGEADAIASLRQTVADVVTALDRVEQRRRTTLEEVHRRPGG